MDTNVKLLCVQWWEYGIWWRLWWHTADLTDFRNMPKV